MILLLRHTFPTNRTGTPSHADIKTFFQKQLLGFFTAESETLLQLGLHHAFQKVASIHPRSSCPSPKISTQTRSKGHGRDRIPLRGLLRGLARQALIEKLPRFVAIKFWNPLNRAISWTNTNPRVPSHPTGSRSPIRLLRRVSKAPKRASLE